MRRDMRRDMVQIGFVKANGTLVTQWIPADAVGFARAHGWMVFDDFERLIGVTT